MSRIEVREEKRDRHWVVRVDPVFDPENKKRGFQPRVTAFCDMDYSFEDHDYHWRRAIVTCSSMSDASGDEATNYANAIEICAEKAREMDVEHKFRSAEVKA